MLNKISFKLLSFDVYTKCLPKGILLTVLQPSGLLRQCLLGNDGNCCISWHYVGAQKTPIPLEHTDAFLEPLGSVFF